MAQSPKFVAQISTFVSSIYQTEPVKHECNEYRKFDHLFLIHLIYSEYDCFFFRRFVALYHIILKHLRGWNTGIIFIAWKSALMYARLFAIIRQLSFHRSNNLVMFYCVVIYWDYMQGCIALHFRPHCVYCASRYQKRRRRCSAKRSDTADMSL